MLRGERTWPTMLDDAVVKYKTGRTNQREVLRIFGEEARERLAHEDTKGRG